MEYTKNMINEIGSCSFLESGPDSANVPVDVWLTPTDEDDENKHLGKWCLRADNYMPRKACLGGETTYLAYSDDKAELEKIVQEQILPLYRDAIASLEAMCTSPKGGRLYYWDKPEKETTNAIE